MKKSTNATKSTKSEVKEMEKKFDIYEMVTQRVIAQMEKGEIPWKKPWFNVNDGAFSHRDGRCYSMLNQIALGDNHEYVTFKEIKAEHGKLKKGSKAKYVFYWNFFKVTDTDKDGNEVEHTVPFLKYYMVFDIADTEGLKPRERKVGTAEEVPEAEKVVKEYIKRSGVKLTRSRTSNEAYYSPLADSITVPCKKQYDITAEYYSTLFHEMTHSTGHPSRLARFNTDGTVSAFGSEDYSKEELVAELGAASLTNYCNLEVPESFNNSVAYLENWLTALKNDKKLIVSATSKAQKAINFILGISPEKAQAEEK